MTRVAFFFFVPLLIVGCHKTVATESPTNVQVGPVAAGETPTGESSPSPPIEKKPAGSCGLRATLRELPSKDTSWHHFAIDLTNEGQKPVKLVLPGDGSTEGWRTPSLTFTATNQGKEVAKQEMGRCGMMNSLKAEEVFTLNPGETKTLSEWVDPIPFEDGTHNVKVRYKNDPSLGTKGKTSTDDAVAKAFASTDTCEVTSNAIKVTYVNPKNP